MLLQLRAVSRMAGARTIVDEVGFSLARGEVVALLGPSGSGKTSLMRLIAGFDAPDAGSIVLAGQEVSTAGRVLRPPEHRALAVAFQDATLFPQLDAVDNVAFALREGSHALRRMRAREALAGMGLHEVDGREVGTLSGGEAQRVALARALVAEGRLLLLDEPFGNVDRLTRADLLQRLRRRLPTSQGALIVTHDLADAIELRARVLLLHRGRLVADGSFESIASGAHGPWAMRFVRGAHLEAVDHPGSWGAAAGD